MKRKRIGILFLLTILVLVFIMPANVMAGVSLYGLELTSESSFTRPDFEHSGTCTPPDGFSEGEGTYFYDTISFTPTETDEYNIKVTAFAENVFPLAYTKDETDDATARPGYTPDEGDSVLYIYENSFDPSNPLTNLIAGNDDDPNSDGLLSSIPYFKLTGGTTYIVVVSTYDSETTATASVAIDNEPDTTPPTIIYAEVDHSANTEIFIELSESCTGIDKDNDGGFTVEKYDDPTTTYAVTAIESIQDSMFTGVVLTVEDYGMAGRVGLLVKYSPTGNGTIADTREGNLMEAQDYQINGWDFHGPEIVNGGISADNSFVDVNFHEGVYGDENGSMPALLSCFDIDYIEDVEGNRRTNPASITSIKKPDSTIEADASALTGGETVIRFFISIDGATTPPGGVRIEALSEAIYDKLGNSNGRSYTDEMPFNEDGKVWIRFEENWGLEDLEDIHALPGTVITLPDENALTGDGKFWGWAVLDDEFLPRASFLWPDYLPGDEYVVTNIGKTLYAVWSDTNAGTTMIMYFAGSGEGTTADMFPEGTGTLSDGTGFVRNGWLIDGWSIDGIPHNLGAPAPAGEALTAKAIWAEDANNNGIKDSEEAGNSDNPKTQDTSSGVWALSLFALLAAIVVIKKKEIIEQ